MCSGKTTLGRALAATFGCAFVDLDDAVEARAGCSISELFATRGEAFFRRLEQETLNELSSGEPSVVATGGGTPCRPGAMEAMKRRGTVVWLEPKRERLLERLLLPEQRAKRPLLAARADDEIVALVDVALAEREPYYRLADLRFDSTELETEADIALTASVLHDLLIAEWR